MSPNGSASPVRVAILVMTYNSAATVGETLSSLNAAPDAPGFVTDVHVFDNASTDDTLAVVARHRPPSRPLEIHARPANIGHWRSLNSACLHLADSHDWILILHSDDVAKPCWLPTMPDAIARSDDKVAAICSSYDRWDPVTGLIEPGEDVPDRGFEIVPGNAATVRDTLEKGCWFQFSGSAMRLAPMAHYGRFPETISFSGDWEWLVRCLASGWSIGYVPRTTILYRQHGSSMSSTAAQSGQDIKDALALMLEYRGKGYVTDAELAVRKRRYVGWVARRAVKRTLQGDFRGAGRLARLGLGIVSNSAVSTERPVRA